MINKDILNALKPLISDPGWAVIVNRLEYIRKQADIDLHNANGFQAYCEAKGAYKQAERLYQLFSQPNRLADDGIVKFPGVTEA